MMDKLKEQLIKLCELEKQAIEKATLAKGFVDQNWLIWLGKDRGILELAEAIIESLDDQPEQLELLIKRT